MLSVVDEQYLINNFLKKSYKSSTIYCPIAAFDNQDIKLENQILTDPSPVSSLFNICKDKLYNFNFKNNLRLDFSFLNKPNINSMQYASILLTSFVSTLENLSFFEYIQMNFPQIITDLKNVSEELVSKTRFEFYLCKSEVDVILAKLSYLYHCNYLFRHYVAYIEVSDASDSTHPKIILEFKENFLNASFDVQEHILLTLSNISSEIFPFAYKVKNRIFLSNICAVVQGHPILRLVLEALQMLDCHYSPQWQCAIMAKYAYILG